MQNPALVWFAVLIIATVHMLAGHLRFLSTVPRNRWLSAGGGMAVAYAFLHLLPELQAHQEILKRAGTGIGSFIEHQAYFIALLGLACFYGLERWAKRSRKEPDASQPDATPPQVFWVSIGAFGLYNALLGYLLAHEGQESSRELLVFTLAVSVHFAVNDHGLYQHHKALYARFGRWILAGAAVIGGTAASFLTLPEPLMAAPMAFLIGAIVLNVLKEELPEERESRFGAFATGALAFAGLLAFA